MPSSGSPCEPGVLQERHAQNGVFLQMADNESLINHLITE